MDLVKVSLDFIERSELSILIILNLGVLRFGVLIRTFLLAGVYFLLTKNLKVSGSGYEQTVFV